MENEQLRLTDTMRRVRDYGATRTDDFPATTLGGKMFAEVAAAVEESARSAAIQAASRNNARVNTATKARFRALLREAVRAINRTGRAIAEDHPDLKTKFRLDIRGDERLLATARAFAEHAEPLVAEFTKHEMPADFLVKLRSDIESFEAALIAQNQSAEAQIKARASMRAALAGGMKAIHHLHPIVRNKYANDEPNLAAWESASHVERHVGRPRNDTTSGEPTSDSSKAKSSGG